MHWLAYMQDWVDLLKRSCGLNLRIQFKKYKFYIVNRKQHISGISLYCSQNITHHEKENHSAKSQCIIIIIGPRQTFASQTLGQDQLVLGLGREKDPPSPFQLQLTIGRALSTQKGECQQSKVWYSAQHRGVLIVSLNIEHLLVQLLVHCWPEKFGKHWTHHWFMLLLQVVVCQCSHISNRFLCNLSWVQNSICRTSYCKTVCDEMCVCLTVCVCHSEWRLVCGWVPLFPGSCRCPRSPLLMEWKPPYGMSLVNGHILSHNCQQSQFVNGLILSHNAWTRVLWQLPVCVERCARIKHSS